MGSHLEPGTKSFQYLQVPGAATERNFVEIPAGPGIGVTLDRGKLQRYASRVIVLQG